MRLTRSHSRPPWLLGPAFAAHDKTEYTCAQERRLMSGALIEIETLSKSFDGGKSFAVRDASVTVRLGVFVALVGGSGSGQTTLLKSINRLIEPDSGEVRIRGEAVDREEAPAVRRRIGYVFQDIGLFPLISVAQNIGIPPPP